MSPLSIETDPEHPLWSCLQWEGVFWRKIYNPLFLKWIKVVSSASSLQEAEALFNRLEEKLARQFAVKALAQRALFSCELAQKLRKKGFSEQIIPITLSFFQRTGALQDEDLMKLNMEKEIKKGRGFLCVQAKWQKKGLKDLVHLGPDWDLLEQDALKKLLQRKGVIWNALDWKEKQKVMLFLKRRGFRKETINTFFSSEDHEC